MSAVARDIHGLVGRGELLRRGPGLQGFPASRNSDLAVLMSGAEPMGNPPGKWTVTLQSQRHGIRSVAKRIRPMRCLPSRTE